MPYYNELVWRVIAQQTTTKYNRMFFVDTAKNIYTRCILIFTHKTCTDVYKAMGGKDTRSYVYILYIFIFLYLYIYEIVLDNCILLSFPTIRIALQFGYQIISYVCTLSLVCRKGKPLVRLSFLRSSTCCYHL